MHVVFFESTKLSRAYLTWQSFGIASLYRFAYLLKAACCKTLAADFALLPLFSKP
jgi:hypothetical protein